MARKKYDFRPDKTQSGVLNKLYLTKKQRLSLLKWGLYSLVLLVLLLIQDVIMSRVAIFGATTDLIPLAILMICILQDADTGGVFALVASAMYQFSGSAPGPYVIVLLTGLGIGAAIFRQSYLRKGLGATLLCSGVGLVLYELLLFAAGLFLGRTYFWRIGAFLLCSLYTLVLAPALYPILISIGKIGGEIWKE